MTLIERSTIVDVPAEHLFAYLADHSNVPRYSPNVSRVETVRSSTPPQIGDGFRGVYSVLGMEIPITYTLVTYNPPRVLSVRLSGGMHGTMTTTLDPQGQSTRLTVRVEYTMPGGVIGKAVDMLVFERMNEKNIERLVENVKLGVESQALA